MSRLAIFLSAATLAAWVGPGAGAAEFPDKAGVVKFTTPSENTQCTYIAKATATYTPKDGAPELTCDRANPKYVRVTIGGKDGALTRVDNPPGQSCCVAEPVLKYGESWKAGPFTCRSDKEGLTCRHEKGHGLFLGLKAIRTN